MRPRIPPAHAMALVLLRALVEHTMTEPQAELLKDHAEMERLLSLLAQAVDANDDNEELRCLWTKVEGMILDHIRTEEREFFAMVGKAHRAEVEELRADHRHIRASLSALGVEMDLHAVRKSEVDELILFLRGHAERENDTMYYWLSERPDNAMANIVHRLLLRRSGEEQESV